MFTHTRRWVGLVQVKLHQMTRDERMAFFINIYNALVVHAMALFGPAESTLKRCDCVGSQQPESCSPPGGWEGKQWWCLCPLSHPVHVSMTHCQPSADRCLMP